MAYIVNKTNGVIVATVQDAALDNSTSLTFIGRNYAGYGEIQNENFVKLLENFANTAAPSKPIEGQIWFDTLNHNVNIYDGIVWKPLAVSNVTTDSSQPGNPKLGDLWYDAVAQQLYAYNGTSFALIGPASGADLLASWKGSYEYSLEAADNVPVYNAKAVVGTDETVIAVVSDRTYTIQTSPGSESYPMAGQTQKIYKGITLAGANPITGSSISAGNYFWGTAAEALSAQTAGGFTFSTTTATQKFNVLFASTGTSGLCYVNTGLQYNPGNQTLYVPNLVVSGTFTSGGGGGSGLGVGQTWSNPTRSGGSTSYQNTTGAPIFVVITDAGPGGNLQVSTDNSTWIGIGPADSTTGNASTVGGIIPNNSYYRYTGTHGGWAELR